MILSEKEYSKNAEISSMISTHKVIDNSLKVTRRIKTEYCMTDEKILVTKLGIQTKEKAIANVTINYCYQKKKTYKTRLNKN